MNKCCFHTAQPSKEDMKEIDIFKRYLKANGKYGEKALLRRRFWRIYLGFEKK